MAPDKLSRDPDAGGEEPAEGVRIIDAEELEEVAERREVVRRRSPDEPGYKDRPPSPPTDVRPDIRFPLPGSADASTVERPRPAPVDASRGEHDPELAADPAPRPSEREPVDPGSAALGPDDDEAVTDDVQWADQVLADAEIASPAAPGRSEDEPAPAVDPPVAMDATPAVDPAAPPAEEEVPPLFDQAAPDEVADVDAALPSAGATVGDEVPSATAVPGEPAAADRPGDVPPVASSPGPDADVVPDVAPDAGSSDPILAEGATPDHRPPPPDAGEPAPPVSAPVLDLGPQSGEHRLPHWTEPPTGEVPRVVIGAVEPDPDQDERWASFTAGATRWRDEHDSSEHGDLVADLASHPDEPVSERLGALDTSDRLTDDAFLNFDDVDLDPERRPRRSTRRGRSSRGSRSAPPPPPEHDPLAAIISLDEPVPARPARPEAPAARSVTGPTRRLPGLGSQGPPPADDPAAPRARRRPPVEERRDGGGGGRNVPQAVAVGVGLAVVALLALKAGPAVAMVLVEIVVVLAGAEYYGAVQRGGFRPATLLGLTAVAALPLAAYWRGEAAFPLILFLVFAVGVLWYLLGVGGPVRPTANLGVTVVGVVWVGVLGAYAALILDIPAQGPSILLVAIVSAVAHDAGGFFIGRATGRTPFTAVSPGKTVEGLIGGILSALLAVFVVAVLLGVGPFSAGEALVFGLVTALVAPFGDLAESLFKRDLGLKDMGSILPQHGGVLDRFDAMLFVLPTAYYAVRVLGLAG